MKKQPIIAIVYDFDKTLSSEDMQNYSFIPALGMNFGMKHQFFPKKQMLKEFYLTCI